MPDDLHESNDAPHAMACMEIWGGNQATQRAVTLPGLKAWVYSRPYQDADGGGDVYYVSSCATGRITRLLVADVCGHGAEVAETADQLRLLMRQYVNHVQQVKFVTSMNGHFASLSEAGGFATAVVATFLATSRTFTFSNAGHPTPLVYRASDRKWHLLEGVKDDQGHRRAPRDLPLGIFESATYQEMDLTLDVGDLVLFYTDAFIESHDASGELIGSQAFLELVRQLDVSHPETLPEQIVARITSLHPGNLTADDVTLMLFQPTGEAARVPLQRRLLAPFRLLGGICTSLLRGGRGVPLPEISRANLAGGSYVPLSRRRSQGNARGAK